MKKKDRTVFKIKESGKIGRYSGNHRLALDDFEEVDVDNEYTKEMWLLSGEIQNDPDFHKDIKKKLKNWKDAIRITADPSEIVVHTVGESHIDCAWLWRFEQTREKAYKTFKKAVEHGDLFPDTFNFALSEPLLLEWVKEDHPDLFEEIKRKVKEGNIELVGGSYVEPDCMMPSGEAFVRMRLYGMRFIRDNFGPEFMPEVEWFLDSFGYNWGIPQILVKSGAKYFWTSKLTWNLDTIFPFVNFWWQGPDGSKILTANFQMGTAPLNTWIMYEVGRHPLKKDGLKTWNYEIDYEDLGDHIEEEEICPHVGNFFGKGDGGHGPTHQEVAVQNEYCKDPMFKWSRVHDFFKELEKWSERFPIWKDELYLENHRGTFSVHAEVKRYNRKNENMLVVLEGLAVLMKIYGIDFKYPYDKLEWAWKTTLKNQFHDVLPGSSIPEVYDDVYDDWMEQEKTYGQIIADVGDCLIEKAEQKEMAQEKSEKSDQIIIFLYNNLPWDRKSPIFIPVTIFNKANNEKTANIFSEDGKTPKFAILEEFDDAGNIKARYICQPIKEESENIMERMSAGWWAIPELPALSIKEFKLRILSKNDDPQLSDLLKSPFIISENKQSIQLDNTITSLKISKETGAILELKSKNINNSENLLKGDTSNLTFAYVDKPKNWPAWNLEHYWKRPIKVKNNKDVSVKITENGPIFATIEINKTILKNKITQKLRLFKEFPEVYLEYLTNWDRPETILKVEYATSTNAEEVVSDIAYGAISRKTKPQTRADKARFEKIMHKYCDLSSPDKSWGIAIINEGKYAFDTLKDNETFRLTMLRSPRYPDPSGESWVHKERKYNKDKYNHKPPKYSGIGPFKARYKIVPHQGGALIKNDGTPNSVVRKSAEEFNQPVVIISAKGTTSAKKDLSKISGVLEIESENIYLGVLKLNEWQKDDSIILRLVEGCGIETDGAVKIHEPFKSQIKEIVAVDLLERDIDDPLEWDSAKGLLKFKIAPFEIKTFKIRI